MSDPGYRVMISEGSRYVPEADVKKIIMQRDEFFQRWKGLKDELRATLDYHDGNLPPEVRDGD